MTPRTSITSSWFHLLFLFLKWWISRSDIVRRSLDGEKRGMKMKGNVWIKGIKGTLGNIGRGMENRELEPLSLFSFGFLEFVGFLVSNFIRNTNFIRVFTKIRNYLFRTSFKYPSASRFCSRFQIFFFICLEVILVKELCSYIGFMWRAVYSYGTCMWFRELWFWWGMIPFRFLSFE